MTDMDDIEKMIDDINKSAPNNEQENLNAKMKKVHDEAKAALIVEIEKGFPFYAGIFDGNSVSIVSSPGFPPEESIHIALTSMLLFRERITKTINKLVKYAGGEKGLDEQNY